MLVRCKTCNTPVAEAKDGTLVIIQRHHGEKHTSTFTREEIIQLLTTEEDSPDEQKHPDDNP